MNEDAIFGSDDAVDNNFIAVVVCVVVGGGVYPGTRDAMSE